MSTSSVRPQGKGLDADEYAARHDAALDFEPVCLQARLQCNVRQLRALQPQSVLEVGCGPVSLAEQVLAHPNRVQRWVVVEPARRYADLARQMAQREPRILVIEDYIELAQQALEQAWCDQPAPDMVVVSAVIHETAAPQVLLRAALSHLCPGGVLLVSVPNAQSFHRLLAVQMGLMDRPDAVGERNRMLGQPSVFDLAALRSMVAELGLVETHFEGYLFKPFTHAQMAHLLPLLPDSGVQGLIDLGRQFPEHAAEICLVAKKR